MIFVFCWRISIVKVMWKLRFVVLIIEMMQLWLNNVFNHEIWLGNELISRMEKTKIPPSSLGGFSQRGELEILIQLIRIVWNCMFINVNTWKRWKFFKRKEKNHPILLFHRFGQSPPWREGFNFDLINIGGYV